MICNEPLLAVRCSSRLEVLPVSPIALIEKRAPRARVRGVPIKGVARKAFVEKTSLVQIDLGRRTVGVRAGIEQRPKLGTGFGIELERKLRVVGTHQDLRIIKGDFALDAVAHAPVTLDGLQIVAEFRWTAQPSSDLVGVNDEGIAVPEANRFTVPFGIVKLFGRVPAPVGVNPADVIPAVAFAQCPYFFGRYDELLGVGNRRHEAAGKTEGTGPPSTRFGFGFQILNEIFLILRR